MNNSTPATTGTGGRMSVRGDLLALALIGTALPLFFWSGPAWFATDWGNVLSNLAHIPFFALLTALLHRRLPLTTVPRWLSLTLAVLVLSLAIETLQVRVGRSASWLDILRNLTGAWLALFWLQRGRPMVWTGRLAASGLLAYELFAAASLLVALRAIDQRLPLLADFEEATVLERFQPLGSELRLSDQHASEGRHSLAVELRNQRYSGLSFQPPADWRGYTRLSFDLYNPGAPATMTLRIHDIRHEFGENRWAYNDRFNRSLSVEQGWNHYQLELQKVAAAPDRRRLAMDRIRDLTLFAVSPEDGRRIHLDNLRLGPPSRGEDPQRQTRR